MDTNADSQSKKESKKPEMKFAWEVKLTVVRYSSHTYMYRQNMET